MGGCMSPILRSTTYSCLSAVNPWSASTFISTISTSRMIWRSRPSGA
jgi:hypothetical protein